MAIEGAMTDKERHIHYAKIDTEHDLLHKVLTEVSETIYTAAIPTNELVASLERLIEKISDHFRREETIMEELNYPALTQHQHQHETLEPGFREILREIKAGDCIDSTKALYKIFEDRLDKHTTHSDTHFIHKH